MINPVERISGWKGEMNLKCLVSRLVASGTLICNCDPNFELDSVWDMCLMNTYRKAMPLTSS